jgi:hypothetical protein
LLATSASSGRACKASTVVRVHSSSSARSGVLSVNWYCVRLMRSSMPSSCTGWNQAVMPGTRAARSRSRSMAWAADRLRSPCGASEISMRPALSVALLPSTPMKEDRPATGASCSSAAASACWRSAMAANEMPCGASVTTWMAPLSCCGKKP